MLDEHQHGWGNRTSWTTSWRPVVRRTDKQQAMTFLELPVTDKQQAMTFLELPASKREAIL